MAFPWMLLATIGAPLLQKLLFGGDQNQTQTRETVQETPNQYDPGYGMLSPFMMKALMSNLQGLSGAGMPGGQGLGMEGMFNDVLGVLEQSWPEIMKEYGKGSQLTKKEGPKATDCSVNCTKKKQELVNLGYSSENVAKAFSDCMAQCGKPERAGSTTATKGSPAGGLKGPIRKG